MRSPWNRIWSLLWIQRWILQSCSAMLLCPPALACFYPRAACGFEVKCSLSPDWKSRSSAKTSPTSDVCKYAHLLWAAGRFFLICRVARSSMLSQGLANLLEASMSLTADEAEQQVFQGRENDRPGLLGPPRGLGYSRASWGLPCSFWGLLGNSVGLLGAERTICFSMVT